MQGGGRREASGGGHKYVVGIRVVDCLDEQLKIRRGDERISPLSLTIPEYSVQVVGA